MMAWLVFSEVVNISGVTYFIFLLENIRGLRMIERREHEVAKRHMDGAVQVCEEN